MKTSPRVYVKVAIPRSRRPSQVFSLEKSLPEHPPNRELVATKDSKTNAEMKAPERGIFKSKKKRTPIHDKLWNKDKKKMLRDKK